MQQWKNEEIQLNTGASADLIGKAEAATSFVFPKEFKRLYMEADGFQNFGWSKTMFSVWPLERI
ncbi:hypothetical protein [Chitinophaga sp.]|uniref:hypothetical protein n=1 Tax=Chitinophaga sp. TaxID=1869181 RepID=UPI0031CFB607